MFIVLTVAAAVIALAHTAPAPFIIDWAAGERGVWSMPSTGTPTVYLTYDDGPNPSTTPDVLDVLAAERVQATFFIIDEHLTDTTAWIVRRTFQDGHAVALHAASRRFMLMSRSELAAALGAAASRIEHFAGGRPCRAFRPHAGWRSGQLYDGLRAMDYDLIGFGWMLWDFNWLRPREAGATFHRVAPRVSDGDIVVLHDGDESAPTRDQRHTVHATARLIPELRRRGFSFGRICDPSEPETLNRDAIP
jgi:peptidoglycan-N-acetylglucosamine deacetylase